MLEAAKSLFLVLSALFPIVDPLGGSPFFLALTSEYAPESRKILSRQIALDSFLLLVGSYFVGTYILAFFGISLPVVQVGGGMVLVVMGWATLMEKDEAAHGVPRKGIQCQDVLLRSAEQLVSFGLRIHLSASVRYRDPAQGASTIKGYRSLGIAERSHGACHELIIIYLPGRCRSSPDCFP